VIVLLLALACGPKPADLPPEFNPKGSPLVPAMDAPLYTSGLGLPKDALVAQVALGHRWDEALSGAAASIALDTSHAPTLEGAQHAAHRAGYPYTVKSLNFGWMDVGVYPEELGRSLAATLREGDDLGLARVRTQDRDRWVALVAHPVDRIAPIFRELRMGAELPIKASSPGTWTVVSPSGKVQRGTTPAKVVMNEAGEWWLEVRSLNTQVVSLPVYVDMATPPAPMLELPGESVTGPADAVAYALDLLDDVRDSFAMVPLQRDGTLDTLAGLPLGQVLDKSWTQEGGEARLRAAGFVGGPAYQIQCQASSVANCIDKLMRAPVSRAALLHPGLRLVGGGAQVRTDGVTLLLNLASE